MGIEIEDQSFSVNSVLSRILTRSNQYFDSRPKVTCSPSSLPGRLHIDLPDPPPLLPALVAAGARLDVAQAMQATYHQHACEFRKQSLAAISRACSKLAHISSTCSLTPNETIIAAFQQVYLKKLNSWINEGVASLREKGSSVLCCREGNGRVPAKTSKTFNHQYIPLLDLFFEDNPFPTHADKVFLAKKSGMTYRQIHVWFQNRRNRTKKVSRKKPCKEGATLLFDTVIRNSEKSEAGSLGTKLNVPFSNQHASVSIEAHKALGEIAPLHAFPTAYPPNCHYDPFPSIPTFATPDWPRRLVRPSSEKPCQPVVDIDELTDKFSRLNVRGDSQSRSRREGAAACDRSAATSAITVKPFSAPHPARIRTTVAPPLPRMTLKAIPAPVSSHNVFRSPSPGSQMMTLVPTLSHRRKIAPLPTRISSKPPDFTFDPVSGSSPSPSSRTRSSRSSSHCSEPSMQWLTHESWDSSSTTTTPEASTLPLS